MHGEHAVEDLRGNEVEMRAHQLDANDEGFDATDDKKDQSVNDVEDTEALVVNRCHPAVKRFQPLPACSCGGSNRDCIG